jgi:GT2 family glycosyltransferase
MRISVVVPTYNRPELLDRCLSALMAQDIDRQTYEIIVADDGASECVQQLVERVAAGAGVAIRYVAVRGPHGPAAARNLGWRSACGEIVAFTDDDTVPDKNWLRAGLAVFDANPEVAAVTGCTLVPLGERPTDYERNESHLATAEFITANCFCRRAVLKELGGFDERFRVAWCEDSDLHFRLLEVGLPIRSEPAAIVVHPIRPAPWGVSLKLQRKSQFNALLYKKHPQLYRQKIRPVRPWNYYASVLCLIGAATAWAAPLAASAGALWLALTVRFAIRRLRGNTLRPAHVAEMLVTSALIPPLSIYWRLHGAARFRAVFF